MPVELHYTGAKESEFRQWLGNNVALVSQAQGDLTDRLLAALAPAPVIFFGADTPDLDSSHIASAISALNSNEVVIGPAYDGGYYLIGMKRAKPELFTDMPWSTDQVMPETLSRLAKQGIEPVLIETLHDCDRPEDLQRWPRLAA
jgi:rSAM/selenodomain-associated transferase 1